MYLSAWRFRRSVFVRVFHPVLRVYIEMQLLRAERKPGTREAERRARQRRQV